MDFAFESELVEASRDNTSGIICYLLGLWRISILNLCKYSDAQINLRFSLSVEEVDSDICLAIPNAAP